MINQKPHIKTEWNLAQFYNSLNDPQIEKDAEVIERAYVSFAKKFKNKTDYLKSEKMLFEALREWEKLSQKTTDGKPLLYASYVKELDSQNEKAQALISRLDERFTKAGNQLVFFELSLGRIDKNLQKKFLKSTVLAPYRYYLKKIFETAKHNLSEAEEKILNLKSATSFSMWVDGVEKAQSKLEVRLEKKDIPLDEAISLITTLPTTEERQGLFAEIKEKLKTVADFAESEMNAVVTNKKVNDQLRGFKYPYSATILGYQNDEKSVLNLADTVTKNFPISHRFYAIKKRILGLPSLTYADRAIPIGKNQKKISFEEAVDTVREVFYKTDSLYGEIFDSYLKNGQIDVYPKKGKAGGAYCSSNSYLPTFVLLNHVDKMESLLTLAHEMGHAIHGERSKSQPLFYKHYTTSVAETASTFFESVVFDALFEKLPPEEKISALHDKIQEDIGTIFRQIAFFNFELELHTTIRKEGYLSKEKIVALLNSHLKKQLGPSVDLKEDDGYLFIYVSHFRRPFYVYSYAYGQLISKALLSRYKQDNSYIKKIDTFLSAGSSKTPEQIFKDIGIDTFKPKVFEDGLKEIEHDVAELDRLTSPKKKSLR